MMGRNDEDKTCEYLLQKMRRLWFDSCWSGYGIAFDSRESIWISCEFGLDLAIIFGLVCDFYGLFEFGSSVSGSSRPAF